MNKLLNEFKNNEFIIQTETDLEDFSKNFSKALKKGDIVSLNGTLGAGKTTFVRYLVKALGVDVSVSSPSYVLENIYKGKDFSVSHWDLYRLRECPIELLDEEFKGSIVLIEWANKFEEVNEISDISLNFEILEDNRRKIIVK